jgi:transposase
MISQIVKRNSVGIDTGKKILDVCKLATDNSITWRNFETEIHGLNHLLKFTNKDDMIVMEAGNQAFRIAKYLLSNGFKNTYVLNTGDLANIYNSLKKTDKEDSLKLARLAARIPIDELPVVPIPSDKCEHARHVLREQEFWTKQMTVFKNKLHAVFVHFGITHINRKALSSKKNRNVVLKLLSGEYFLEADRLNKSLDQFEEMLKEVEKNIQSILSKEEKYTTIAMSIPGVGPATALAMYAYLEDCKRFSSAKQVGYYAGLVPRIYMSGDKKTYGRITKRGARQLRRTTIQAAWSCVRSKHGGCLADFYCRLFPRTGKKKAIVATARKMLEIFYVMIKTEQKFIGVPEDIINKKLKRYKIKK